MEREVWNEVCFFMFFAPRGWKPWSTGLFLCCTGGLTHRAIGDDTMPPRHHHNHLLARGPLGAESDLHDSDPFFSVPWYTLCFY